MFYLMTQIASLLTLSLLLGFAFGWLAHRLSKVWSQQHTHLAELEDVRRHYRDLVLQNVALRQQLQQVQATLRKVRVTPSETDYGEFLQIRKALEQSRQEYQTLLEQYHRQQQLEQLQQTLQRSRSRPECQAVHALASSAAVTAPTMPSGRLPAATAIQHDDLTCLQGVTVALAKRLAALGICSYRQLAESNSADIQSLHTLLGTDLEVHPEQWVQEARQRLQSAQSTFSASCA
ncbi:MAG: hypothetical protein ACK4RS_07145 [Thiothrix sp.]